MVQTRVTQSPAAMLTAISRSIPPIMHMGKRSQTRVNYAFVYTKFIAFMDNARKSDILLIRIISSQIHLMSNLAAIVEAFLELLSKSRLH